MKYVVGETVKVIDSDTFFTVLVINLDTKLYLLMSKEGTNIIGNGYSLKDVLEVVNDNIYYSYKYIIADNIDSYNLQDNVYWFMECNLLKVDLDEVNNLLNGMNCEKCKNYYKYVEPNIANGKYICYNCRS